MNSGVFEWSISEDFNGRFGFRSVLILPQRLNPRTGEEKE